MIKVTFGNTTSRSSKVVDPSMTIGRFLEEEGLDYSTTTFTLNGTTVQPDGFSKSFSDHGITDQCYLLSVVKADNA